MTFIYQPQGPPSTSINYKLAPISAAFTNPSENKDPQDSCLKLSGWTLSLPALQQLGTGTSGASCRLFPPELPFTRHCSSAAFPSIGRGPPCSQFCGLYHLMDLHQPPTQHLLINSVFGCPCKEELNSPATFSCRCSLRSSLIGSEIVPFKPPRPEQNFEGFQPSVGQKLAELAIFN